MEVRAYVTEPQLSGIHLGQEVRVSVDVGGGRRQIVSGSISWISAKAEFTPTPIQTRDERVDMVYAIKIRVANDAGLLKIGMPVDVQFSANQAAR
jgi:HlyD family secretion protein